MSGGIGSQRNLAASIKFIDVGNQPIRRVTGAGKYMLGSVFYLRTW